MAVPKSAGPFACNLPATKIADDPCLTDNPNRSPSAGLFVKTAGEPTRTGWASYYGTGFHGGPNTTAIGEIFDTYDYTVAMRDARLHGRYVLIERLDEKGTVIGKVIARVTDWGPATSLKRKVGGKWVNVPVVGKDGRHRVADLSKGTFVALGGDEGLQTGQIRIRITVVEEKTPSDDGVYRVTVATLPSQREALQYKWAMLRKMGQSDFQATVKRWQNNPKVYTVRTLRRFHYARSNIKGQPPKKVYDGFAVLIETTDQKLYNGYLDGAAKYLNIKAIGEWVAKK